MTPGGTESGLTENKSSLCWYQQVLRFDVSVDDVHAVQVLDGSRQVEHHGAGVALAVLSGGSDGVEQVAALQEVET